MKKVGKIFEVYLVAMFTLSTMFFVCFVESHSKIPFYVSVFLFWGGVIPWLTYSIISIVRGDDV